MSNLFLVRHAKSDRGILNVPDIDRPLNQRGYADAPEMAARFMKKNELPEVLITSPAVRAMTTALIFARCFGIPASKLQIVPDLYESSAEKYLQTIRHGLKSHRSIMVFGHNPMISETVQRLVQGTAASLPTCSITGIDYQPEKGKEAILNYYDFPKNGNS